MIRSILIMLFALPILAQTSNVETVKAWTREPVMADLATGELRDTSGQIANGQRIAAIEAGLDESTNLVIGANTGLTNALAALYAKTNRISEYTGRIYIAADMDEADGNSNIWVAVGRDWLEDPTNLNYWVYSNYELATCPRTIWDFELSPTEIVYVDGVPQNDGNAVTNINGFSYFHVKVPRPASVGNVVIRTHKHLKTGHATTPLDLAASGLTLDGEDLYTGSICETNGTRVLTRTYSHGMLTARAETTTGE